MNTKVTYHNEKNNARMEMNKMWHASEKVWIVFNSHEIFDSVLLFEQYTRFGRKCCHTVTFWAFYLPKWLLSNSSTKFFGSYFNPNHKRLQFKLLNGRCSMSKRIVLLVYLYVCVRRSNFWAVDFFELTKRNKRNLRRVLISK